MKSKFRGIARRFSRESGIDVLDFPSNSPPARMEVMGWILAMSMLGFASNSSASSVYLDLKT